MDIVLYFFIAVISTTLGAMTGMGGGVIIKPVLDVLGRYDAGTIGILSAVTVFAMALVSVAKQIQQGMKIPVRAAVPLALGSIAGGNAGQAMLQAIIRNLASNHAVVVVQNICLALLILAVFLYMRKKDSVTPLGASGILPALCAGLFLGTVSSFLGIGGGPINVAFLIFVFALDTKTATVFSIVTILFSQASKLTMVALGEGFAGYELSMLPAMVIGAVAGGFLGSMLSKRLSEKAVEAAFNGVQLLVLAACLFNIIRNWGI